VEQFRKGDFVWFTFTYDEKEVYPGRIIDVEKDNYIVEICTNKKKSSGNDLEKVKGKKHQLQIRVLGL
jgi:hypothetical protein